MPEVVRVLTAFDRDTDELVGKWPIKGLGLPDLQRIFDASDEMYDSYPVRPEHVRALERATGHAPDLERFDYFVDADAV